MRNGEKRASRWSLSNMCFWKQYLRTMHGEKTPKCQALLLGLNQGRVTPALGLLGSLSSNFHRRDTQTATPPTRQRCVLGCALHGGPFVKRPRSGIDDVGHLAVETQTPNWPGGGKGSNADFEARLRGCQSAVSLSSVMSAGPQ